jgi:hypothetical protein
LNLQIAFFAVAAVTATFFYSRTGRLSLGIHASVYLAAAVVLSRIPAFVADAFAGDVPTVPDWRALIVTVAAAVSYVIGSRVREATRIRRILWVIPGAVVGSAAAASAVAGVVRIFNGSFEGAASTLSVVRTTVNCVLAVTLALLGSRWKRVELGWLAYAALAFGTLKLIFEDLRFGNAASLVVSLLFYGLVLILLPRVTRQFGSSS